jgi:hypothetical protein
MSTFLHQGVHYRSQFHELPTRQQFKFVSSPGTTWVKTGMRTYAAPTQDRWKGKGYRCTSTGRVKYWQGATFTAVAGAAVELLYPFIVATEDAMRDW